MFERGNEKTRIGDLEFLGVYTITPEIAEEMLKKNVVNRKLNKKRVSVYAHDMMNNNWKQTSDGLSISIDKSCNLLNGQHRLNAIISSGKALDMYIFKNHEDINALNLPFDTGMKRFDYIILKKTPEIVANVKLIYQITHCADSTSALSVNKFIETLSEDETIMLENVYIARKSNVCTPVNTAFFLSCIFNKDKALEFQETYKLLIEKDYTNEKANRIRDFISNTKIPRVGHVARIAFFYNIYMMINDIKSSSNKYKEKQITEIRNKIIDWAKDRF